MLYIVDESGTAIPVRECRIVDLDDSEYEEFFEEMSDHERSMFARTHGRRLGYTLTHDVRYTNDDVE